LSDHVKRHQFLQDQHCDSVSVTSRGILRKSLSRLTPASPQIHVRVPKTFLRRHCATNDGKAGRRRVKRTSLDVHLRTTRSVAILLRPCVRCPVIRSFDGQFNNQFFGRVNGTTVPELLKNASAHALS
jgi:hypothetical protein